MSKNADQEPARVFLCGSNVLPETLAKLAAWRKVGLTMGRIIDELVQHADAVAFDPVEAFQRAGKVQRLGYHGKKATSTETTTDTAGFELID